MRPYRKLWAMLTAVCVCALILGMTSRWSNAESIPQAHQTTKRVRQVRVMTQNMYVGTDVDKVLAAASPEQIPFLVAEAWATLQATNLAERVSAMADQIARTRPHLIGLQEVSLIRMQSPGDLIVGGSVPAETIVVDFLDSLFAALEARGLEYYLAAIVQNTDVEVPMITPNFTSFDDIRLTDFDAILARGDVATANVHAANFSAALPVAALGLTVLRGWVSVDATIKGATYRFVNTHLEPYEPVQLLQAAELIGGLASETRPLILVGDFNSDAEAHGATYEMLREAGYTDVWRRHHTHRHPGFTCCQAPDLRNEQSLLDRRIDGIFVRHGSARHTYARRIGHRQQDRTPSGLWPSDHAGLFARLLLKPVHDE